MQKFKNFSFHNPSVDLSQIEDFRFKGGSREATPDYGKPVRIFQTQGLQIVSRLARSLRFRKFPPLAYTTPINKDHTVRLPQSAIAWPLGKRVYWRFNTARSLQLSPNPKGAFLYGKYQSSRVKRLGYWNPNSTSRTAPYQAAIARHRIRIQQRTRQANYQRNPRRKS
jgi:hypothetical protein